MAQYENLTNRQMFYIAQRLPERRQVQDLHDYIRGQRELVDGKDVINIPDSHKGVWNGENHEGGLRFNRRIRQLGSWFGGGDVLFSIQPSGPGETVQRGTSIQERFARQGEIELSKGTGLHNWDHEFHRDIAEVGVGIFQQNPRKDYFIAIEDDPESMAEGSRLGDVVWRQRIDPVTWAWDETKQGEVAAYVTTTHRTLSQLSPMVSSEGVAQLFDWFDFGTGVDPEDPNSWGAATGQPLKVAEVWGPTNGGIVILDGPDKRNIRSFSASKQNRVVQTWRNAYGRPPVYVAALGPWPWHSPLDGMAALTNLRNTLATMVDIQTAGAVFRHWQLIDTEKDEDVTTTVARDVPEAILYDPSKPPPYMGPNTEWRLAPFEFIDQMPRLLDVRIQHEAEGAAVGRLMGDAVGSDAAVGTVDIMEDSAQREFADWKTVIQDAKALAWRDHFRWHRREFKDPLYVVDKRRDFEGEVPGVFINTALSLKGSDIQSEHVTVRLDTRSALAKLRDARYAMEMILGGFMDYRRAVELGLFSGVEDADAEILAIFISQLEKIQAETELKAAAVKIQEAILGQNAAPFSEAQPAFLGREPNDRRGSGVQAGPDNVAGTSLDAGGADAARAVA